MRARRTLVVALTTALAAVLAVLIPGPAAAAGTSVEVRNCDGRGEVFYLDDTGRLWHYWEFTPGRQDWSQAQPLGGSGRLIYDQVTAERNHDCRLEVFGVGTNKQMYHIWQLTAGGEWGPFSSMGGGFDGPPTVGKNADGRLEVFGVGETDRMYHAWQTSRGGAWTGWYGMGQTRFRGSPYSPEVGNIAVSRSLWVHAWGTDNCEYANNQVEPGGAWYDEWTLIYCT